MDSCFSLAGSVASGVMENGVRLFLLEAYKKELLPSLFLHQTFGEAPFLHSAHSKKE